MLIISLVLIILTFITVMLVSGNNLSACVGPAIGSRILSKNFGIALGAIGFTLGLLIQGTAMKKSVATLLPNVTPELQAEALLVTIVLFIVADFIRAPLSYTMSLAGLLAGLSLARGTFADQGYLFEVIVMWIIAPIVAIILVSLLLRVFHTKSSNNIWKRLKIFKAAIIVFSFSSAYVLGANTLGLIIATGGTDIITLIAAIIAIFVGSFYLSSGEIKRVSEELFLMRYPNTTVSLLASTVLVEIATVFNIPLSNTQTLSAAVFGAGISYKSRLMSLKPFLTIVIGWIVAPLLSFVLGIVIH
jgi:inorganic phosphate transporter, PiT family